MKMKNLLIGGMSLALVACITIGGTLAYLSDKDGTLTNTFRFAKNIVVDVYETQTGKDDQGKGDANGGFDYANLVSGKVVEKNVKVDLETEAPTYLYGNIKASHAGDYDQSAGSGQMIISDATGATTGKKVILDNSWVAVVAGENGYGLYRYKDTLSADTEESLPVFGHVKTPEVNGTNKANYTLDNIVIDVFAMQSEGYNTTVADQEAKYELGLEERPGVSAE